MSLILSWLILSPAVWVTGAVLPGFHVKSPTSALLVAATFGVLNFLLGWSLVGTVGEWLVRSAL